MLVILMLLPLEWVGLDKLELSGAAKIQPSGAVRISQNYHDTKTSPPKLLDQYGIIRTEGFSLNGGFKKNHKYEGFRLMQ